MNGETYYNFSDAVFLQLWAFPRCVSFLPSFYSTIKENRNASEIVKTVNLLISSLSTDFLWDYMMRCFEECFR